MLVNVVLEGANNVWDWSLFPFPGGPVLCLENSCVLAVCWARGCFCYVDSQRSRLKLCVMFSGLLERLGFAF